MRTTSARVVVLLAAAVACGCGGEGPQVVAATAPATVAAAPSPAPAPNAAPTISGDDRCIGALGADHVFVLVLDDPDGDAVAWEADKDHGQGRLDQSRGGPLAAGTSLTLVYSPPLDRPDENWITVTARDARGAVTSKRLYVKSG